MTPFALGVAAAIITIPTAVIGALYVWGSLVRYYSK